MTRNLAKYLADYYARYARENSYYERRGLIHIENVDCILYYSNHPYVDDESARPKELKRIEKQLQGIGIKVLARGRYSINDDESGEAYTATLLLNCSTDRWDIIFGVVIYEVANTLSYHFSKSRLSK